MNQNKQKVLDDYDIDRIEALAYEYGRLMDWFKKDFPESTMRLEVNNDQRDGTLNYILTVLSGKEMTNNQRHMTNTVTLTRKEFEDPSFMSRLTKSIYPRYKKTISTAFNQQYKEESQVVN